MNKKKYNSPNISISKVYTKTGDRGHTQLVGGKKISKSDLRICSYGEIDELNSYVGGCRQMIIDLKVENDDLHRISDILFCPSKSACDNLKKENIKGNIFFVGDVMFDVALYLRKKSINY